MDKHDQIITQATQNKYQNAEKTKRESISVIKHYPSLLPKKESFVFNDGSEKGLLNLQGTIPVRYKGSSYNIPICMWLLDNYPLSAPMVYIQPTSEMLIRPSKNVDQNGKVYMPYLHEWNPNSSDMMGLIQIMIMTFAEMSPVYAKTRQSPAHYPTPYPTQPSSYMPVNPTPYTPTSGGPAVQYPPPYPSAGQPTQPPYPMYPPTGQQPYPVPGSPAVSPPYPTANRPNQPYPQTPYPYPQTYNNGGVGAANAGGISGSSGGVVSSGTITEEHIRASLVSAGSEMVRKKLQDSYGTAQAEVSALRQQHTDLTTGKVKLEALTSKLTFEQDKLEKSVQHLTEKEGEMRSVVSRVSDDTTPLDVDEAVTTTAPVLRQLVAAYALDQATQDAIFYLGDALSKQIIDLDSYLKHVRALSRRQFCQRATMNICRARANLVG